MRRRGSTAIPTPCGASSTGHTGWGSPSELTTPTYAAKAFLQSLPSNYQDMSLHTAAQDVQRSFNGSLYSQWQDQAKHMVYTIMHSS